MAPDDCRRSSHGGVHGGGHGREKLLCEKCRNDPNQMEKQKTNTKESSLLLCVHCGAPAVSGLKICNKCQERAAERKSVPIF